MGPEASLCEFLRQWDEANKAEHKQIPLLDPNVARKLRKDRQAYFAKVFYHIRGHFHDFLWFVGSHATDVATKRIILENIEEEFGTSVSHEQLYIRFAESLGVDLTSEIMAGTHYLPFARRFNEGHIKWLLQHDADSQMAAFAAYERLDNVDYEDLAIFAENLGVPREARAFFEVHRHAKHFEMAGEEVQALWKRHQRKVQDAFSFITDHQNQMWRELSNAVLSHGHGGEWGQATASPVSSEQS